MSSNAAEQPLEFMNVSSKLDSRSDEFYDLAGGLNDFKRLSTTPYRKKSFLATD